MGEADYSGVASWELAQLIEDHHFGSYQLLALHAGVDARWIYRVLYKEVPWINLSIADAICMALGCHISKDLTVIPSAHNNAARKMAVDEFWAKEIDATPEQVEQRAQELKMLRQIMLSSYVKWDKVA